MSVPDKSIDPRLLSAAKAEFLAKGYKLSSLTDICKAAGVTTGALYKRYTGKDPNPRIESGSPCLFVL